MLLLAGCGVATDPAGHADGAALDAGPIDAAEGGVSDAGVLAPPDGGWADGGSSEAFDGGPADGGAGDGGPMDAGAPCPSGLLCVDSFPFHDSRDTSLSPSRAFASYGCAPAINESGPEIVYRVTVPGPGILGARVQDDSFADIDLHLLRALDPGTCLARNDSAFSFVVEAGTYYLVADTWVDGTGVERVGRYSLSLALEPLPEIPCAMRSEPLPRVQGDVLQLPVTGPVVLEAHLVTPSEPFDGGWPSAARDGIERHYALSEAASRYVMRRREDWAPYGEGGSMWGQGSSIKPPLTHEAWYVNMYWLHRPAPGTRMIIRQPDGGLGVVAAAGYETGPGSATAIGGATEEIHDFLGTIHRSALTMGFAVDQTLPFGPVRCVP
jgi:hypothetical protein